MRTTPSRDFLKTTLDVMSPRHCDEKEKKLS